MKRRNEIVNARVASVHSLQRMAPGRKGVTVTVRVMFVGSVLAVSLIAATRYEVLNRYSGLVGIGVAGDVTGTIPNSLGGNDLAVDSSGNFVIATALSLIKVTPAGESSLIATAPSGSQFISVAIDGRGNFIVGDNVKHRILRVSADGSSIVPVASYPIDSPNEWEDVVVRIDGSGNYVVVEDNGSRGIHVFRITPLGTVTGLTLTGDIPQGSGGLTFDASGNYVVTDYRSNSIFTITPAGAVSLLVNSPSLAKPSGIVWDASTGTFIVLSRGSNTLFSIGPTGTPMNILLSGAPVAIPVGVALVNPRPADSAVNGAESGGQGTKSLQVLRCITWVDKKGQVCQRRGR